MPAPLRVVFLSHVARFSGAEIAMLRVLEAGEELEATVILAEDGPLVEALRSAGAAVEVMPLAEPARALKRDQVRTGRATASATVEVARYIGRLRGRLRELRPELVSTVSLKAGVYGALAARLAGVPQVWHLQDQLDSGYLARQAVLPTRLLVAMLPAAVVTPSHTTLERLGRLRPGVQTAVLPVPIPIPAEPVAIGPQVRRVGIVGRLAPWKGQHVFIEAFASAFPDGEEEAVVIGEATFGEEDYAHELHRLAERLGVAGRVDFRGFRRDVEAELRRLDVLVHASVLIEPFGTAVFEGMAVGLPVIAATGGGPAEYIGHERDGLLHTPGDVAGLAAMMRLYAGDAGLRARLAAAGRERARQLEPARVAGDWAAFYRRLARARTAAAASPAGEG